MAYYIEDPIITWLLSAVCNSHIIKNPYLVAKIVEVLFVINLSLPIKLKNDAVYEKFMDHPMSQTALPSALMKFYTDIETTGQSTEFYDKFTIRFHISIILKSMWERPIHKQVWHIHWNSNNCSFNCNAMGSIPTGGYDFFFTFSWSVKAQR